MASQCILIGSKNKSIIAKINEVAVNQEISISSEQRIEDFLLNVQEKDYKAILFDTNMSCHEAIKTIRLIRHMRPKIPLIVLLNKIDKKSGGQILNEGVFHIILSPNKRNLAATLSAVLKIKN
jgi:DNA-binding NtrC family response regulator